MFSNITNLFNINKSDIKIPEFLKRRNIKDSDILILKKFFKENSISNFSEITIEMLNQFAKFDYDEAIRLNTILGLYGIEFIGKSSKKYSPNSRNMVSLLVSQKSLNLYETKVFSRIYKNIELRFLEYFEKIGITYSEQITGINLSVLLDKLNILNLDIDNIEKDLNNEYFNVVKNNLENFYRKDLEVKVVTEGNQKFEKSNMLIKNTDLSTRAVNCLLANRIDTIEKLQQLNIEEFRTKKNIGYKIINEILSYLNSKGENIPFQEITITRDNIKNKKTNLTINQPEEIDERIYNLEINKLNLPQKIEKALNNKNITNIGKFIENVNLIELKPKEKGLIYKKLGVYGVNKYKKYIPKFIKTPENYFLKISEVFQDDWVVSACKKYNLKNIGLLANVFPDIFGLDEDLVAQDVFFEKINYVENKLNELGISKTPIDLSYFEKKELSKKDIYELANVNYIQKIENIISSIINNPQSYFATQEQLELNLKKELDIITRRYGINCPKETLEEIGQFYGCTRERVRQLEKKVLKRISASVKYDIQKIDEDVKRLLDNFGGIVSYSNKKKSAFDALIKDIVNNIKDRSFDIDYENLCIIKKDFKFENLLNEITDKFKNSKSILRIQEIQQAADEVLSKYLNNTTMEQKTNYLNTYDYLYSKLINDNFMKIDENLYKLISKTENRKKQERDEKLIYWFKKLYPNGIHLPIEKEKEEQVLQSLQPLFDKCPEVQNVKNIRGLCDRLFKNKNSKAIWWGRGVYIHVDNIKVDWNAIDIAIEEIIKRFNNGIYRLKTRAIYDEHKEKFINAGIPNEIALAGLIRYKNNPRINTKRDELRDANNANVQLNILETFEQFILKYPNGINKKDLMFEMCNKRGWQKHQIGFLYSRSNLIYSDNGIYYHKNNLDVNKDKLSEIISLIQKELNENNSTFLHLRKIQNKYPATWVGVLNKNISPSFMGRLMNSELINNDIVIDNYVYVKKVEHLDENISMFNILSKFVEEKSIENKYVTISEIIDYCQKQGIKDTKQPIVDCVLKFSYEYNTEVYVHKNALGYCEEFQEDIFALIQKLSETDFEMPIISYEDIIIEFRDFLPTLNDGYDWNIYLLRSALSSDENLDIFDKTFIFKDNKFGVEDLDDTAAYLIMKNCENGYCKFKELDKLLARYGVTPYKNLHFYKSRLFFEGSSIKSVDNDTAVAVEKFARDKYLNV